MTLKLGTKDRPEPAVGQLWAIGGITYRIDSLSGPDGCYPILMREVARERRVDEELAASKRSHPMLWRHRAPERRRSMQQERAWFEQRTDAVYRGRG